MRMHFSSSEGNGKIFWFSLTVTSSIGGSKLYRKVKNSERSLSCTTSGEYKWPLSIRRYEKIGRTSNSPANSHNRPSNCFYVMSYTLGSSRTADC